MKTNSYLLVVIILLSITLNSCQGQEMSRDYTGATNNLVPKGWTISSNQDKGNYYWIAQANKSDSAPRLIQIIVTDQEMTPKLFQEKMLAESIDQIQIIQENYISPNEAHFILVGKSGQKSLKMATMVVRDPGKHYFLTLFAATPSDYDYWNGHELLYKSLQRNDPYSASNDYSASKTTTDLPTTPELMEAINMQDISIKTEMIQSSAPIKKEQLIGKWIQVFGYPTHAVAQYTATGELLFGSRGQAHLIEFTSNGQYTLSYLYDSVSGVCKNRSEVADKGSYTISGNQLILQSKGYTAKLVVCGSPSNDTKKQVKAKVFTIGMHAHHNHFSIYGSPFDFSVSTSYDKDGQEYILEGFTRVQ